MMDGRVIGVRELLMEFVDEVSNQYQVPKETLDMYVKLVVAAARDGEHE